MQCAPGDSQFHIMADSCCIIQSAACARRVLTSSKPRIEFFTDSYLTPPLHGCTGALTRAERANELENEHHLLANAS
jgi:hypothetical protein